CLRRTGWLRWPANLRHTSVTRQCVCARLTATPSVRPGHVRCVRRQQASGCSHRSPGRCCGEGGTWGYNSRGGGTAMSVPTRRIIRAPRGSGRTCKGWIQEAALRMLMNNLDPEVAEDPDHLVVYGGSGRAARSWEAFDTIIDALRKLEN